MIITDRKEIYNKVEVGDILKHYYSIGSKGNIIESMVTSIKECGKCGVDFICNKYIFTIADNQVGCYMYGSDRCTIISLYKEDFLSKEEMEI